MKELKVCLIGHGRMGQEIESILENYGCKASYIVKKEEDWNEKSISQCDVAIDFSLPSAAFNNISSCIELGIPVVSGTTGWIERLSEIELKIQKHPESAFLYGSNFSLGMNLFFRMNEFTAKLMKADSSYVVELEEIHHTKKLDKPSGTAITLAEDLIKVNPSKNSWVSDSFPKDSEINIKSKRTDKVPGTHIIQYENNIDKITISHEAKSRKGFAVGAILAAKWLVNKKGYYTIKDFIDEILAQ